MIKISVFNKATTPLGFDLTKFVAAMQKYVDTCYSPHWGRQGTVQLTETHDAVPNTWSLVFFDDADQPGALAYHDEEGHEPVSKVFVKTTLDDGQLVSVSATHELVEMLADPPANRYASGANWQTMFAFEVADPVEGDSFDVDGFQMSNFVLPSWFESDPFSGTSQYDFMGKLTTPFTLDAGGYAIVTRAGEFHQVFGSAEKEAKYQTQDRRGRRGAIRKAKLSGPSA